MPGDEYLTPVSKKILASIKTISFTFFMLTVGVSASTVFIKMDLDFVNNQELNEVFLFMTIITILIHVFLNFYFWMENVVIRVIRLLSMYHSPATSDNKLIYDNVKRELMVLTKTN